MSAGGKAEMATEDVTSAELSTIHGVGPQAVRILDEELTARGLAFGQFI